MQSFWENCSKVNLMAMNSHVPILILMKSYSVQMNWLTETFRMLVASRVFQMLCRLRWKPNKNLCGFCFSNRNILCPCSSPINYARGNPNFQQQLANKFCWNYVIAKKCSDQNGILECVPENPAKCRTCEIKKCKENVRNKRCCSHSWN